MHLVSYQRNICLTQSFKDGLLYSLIHVLNFYTLYLGIISILSESLLGLMFVFLHMDV